MPGRVRPSSRSTSRSAKAAALPGSTVEVEAGLGHLELAHRQRAVGQPHQVDPGVGQAGPRAAPRPPRRYPHRHAAAASVDTRSATVGPPNSSCTRISPPPGTLRGPARPTGRRARTPTSRPRCAPTRPAAARSTGRRPGGTRRALSGPPGCAVEDAPRRARRRRPAASPPPGRLGERRRQLALVLDRDGRDHGQSDVAQVDQVALVGVPGEHVGAVDQRRARRRGPRPGTRRDGCS